MKTDEAALVSVVLAQTLTVEFVRAYFIVYFSINTPMSGTEHKLKDVVIHGKKNNQFSWMYPDTYLSLMLDGITHDERMRDTTTRRSIQLFAFMHQFVQENESQFINE
jgi:hypothetical protein